MIKYILFKTSNHPKFRTNYDLLNYTDIFDDIKLLTENDLDDYISNIINNILKKYSTLRGYGYWIWKPYLILQELNKLNDGDILFYSNIHADFSNVKNMFNNIFEDIQKTNKPVFLGNSGCLEYQWTTNKLIKYIENSLNYTFTYNDLHNGQYGAGTICILKNEFSINFIKTWFNLMINGIEYITDIHNNDDDNDPEFIENRHDQSVISLLYKYYKLPENNYINIINSIENNI